MDAFGLLFLILVGSGISIGAAVFKVYLVPIALGVIGLIVYLTVKQETAESKRSRDRLSIIVAYIAALSAHYVCIALGTGAWIGYGAALVGVVVGAMIPFVLVKQ